MGIMVYSLLWVLQDLYHPPYNDAQTTALISRGSIHRPYRNMGVSDNLGYLILGSL